ncbi:MAG: hypothetical protein ACYTG2_07005 [Planctomycetota bacterium]
MNSIPRLGLVLAVVLVVGLVAATAPTTSAQCFGPDQLDIGPCCAPVLPNLPPFPPVNIGGLGICWDDCLDIAQEDLRITWSPPAQISCDEYISQLTVEDAAGIPLLSGTMFLEYTRTWDEFDTTGSQVQVWRFVVKADISPVTGGVFNPCVMPTCMPPVGPHPTAYYYGYMDYMGCAAAGPWENALVLKHMCDAFVHQPIFSDRPGVFHPTSSYAIVAPHSTLQPFVPGNNPAPGGPLISEATRSKAPTPIGQCLVEDRVMFGDLTPLGAGCLCPLMSFPNQMTVREFSGVTACGGAWVSLNILWPSPLPWYHLVTTSIGRWTNPAVYPGEEFAWVDEGLFIHQDACTGDFVELKYGGTTAKGWPAVLHNGITTQNFTDLADNYSAPVSGPHPLPLYGSVMPTEHLIYVNVP